MPQNEWNAWDRAGVAASGFCMAHCLALPAILALLPALTVFEHITHNTHKILGVVLLAISVLAFIPGYRRHRAPIVIVLGACGVGLVLFAAFAGHAWLGELGEVALTLTGSCMLIAAHLCNRAFCRSCIVGDVAPSKSAAT